MLRHIPRRCVHFTGLMEKECRAGVKYEQFKPVSLPCLGKSDQCPSCRFPTPEEIEKKEQEIAEMTGKAMTVRARILSEARKGGKNYGKVDCPCGGKVSYEIVNNGRLRAVCNTCKIKMIE